MLKSEEKKFNDFKLKIEHDLNLERVARVEYENKFLNIQEELKQKNIYISDLEDKINLLKN